MRGKNGLLITEASLFIRNEKCGGAKGSGIALLLKFFAESKKYSHLLLENGNPDPLEIKRERGGLFLGKRVITKIILSLGENNYIYQDGTHGMLRLLREFALKGEGELEFLLGGKNQYSIFLFWEEGKIFAYVSCVLVEIAPVIILK